MVPEARSLKSRCGQAKLPLEALGGTSSCLFQLQEVSCVPWLTVASLPSLPVFASLPSHVYEFFAASHKDTPLDIGFTIIQYDLISILTLVTPVKTLFPVKVTF